jgi:hypothetical protein
MTRTRTLLNQAVFVQVPGGAYNVGYESGQIVAYSEPGFTTGYDRLVHRNGDWYAGTRKLTREDHVAALNEAVAHMESS